MAVRTGISTGDVHTFACGEVVSDSTLNTLQDLAKSMRERGDTVICQHGQRWVNSENAVLMGQCDSTDFTTYPSIVNGWRFENAGYSKYVLDLTFLLSVTAYSAGANDSILYTRILVQHTDKAGTDSTLWDSEIESPARGSEQTATVTGTFANPPASGETEIEKLKVTVYSNQASASALGSTASHSGLISISLKLYDDI